MLSVLMGENIVSRFENYYSQKFFVCKIL